MISCHGYLSHAVTETLPGATNLIVNNHGGLIAYPGFTKPGVASPSDGRRNSSTICVCARP